jgi:hypothetical protein
VRHQATFFLLWSELWDFGGLYKFCEDLKRLVAILRRNLRIPWLDLESIWDSFELNIVTKWFMAFWVDRIWFEKWNLNSNGQRNVGKRYENTSGKLKSFLVDYSTIFWISLAWDMIWSISIEVSVVVLEVSSKFVLMLLKVTYWTVKALESQSRFSMETSRCSLLFLRLRLF